MRGAWVLCVLSCASASTDGRGLQKTATPPESPLQCLVRARDASLDVLYGSHGCFGGMTPESFGLRRAESGWETAAVRWKANLYASTGWKQVTEAAAIKLLHDLVAAAARIDGPPPEGGGIVEYAELTWRCDGREFGARFEAAEGPPVDSRVGGLVGSIERFIADGRFDVPTDPGR